jgi:hypothetical protein
MARIERSRNEQRRIGQPSDQRRIDTLERVIAKLLAQSAIPGSDPDRIELGAIKDKLDQLDRDFPESR